MKVLNVIHHPVFGGPHNEVLRSADLLARRGWDSVTVLPDEPGSGADRLRAAGLEVVELPLHRLRAKPDPRLHVGLTLNFLPEVRRIRNLIERLEIDLVRVVGLTNPHGGLAARLAAKPIVWQIVDTGLPLVAREIARPLADAFLLSGQAVVELYDPAHHFSQPCFTYFPPVDTTLFQPKAECGLRTREALGIPPDARVVGTVSNLNPFKGLEYLLQAAERIHVRVDNVWFLVVGASYASHRRYLAHLKGLIAQSALPPERVIFTDAVPDPEHYYPAMDVKLITSLPRSEGTPTTALEALACGVPVISTNVGAVPEVIDAGRTGLVVPPRDAGALADATVTLLTDERRRASMAERARKSAVERFGVEKYADVITEALEAARTHHLARHRRTDRASTRSSALVTGTTRQVRESVQCFALEGGLAHPFKEQVQRYWEDHPCGAADEAAPAGTRKFFESSESTRAERDGFMREIVRFERWREQTVLEVGCGIGVDTARFARAGADVWAVDFTRSGVALTRSRLASEGLAGQVIRADAEALPFADHSFDLVFSWGVIHHTPCPDAAAAEIQRVCKPGGRVLVMVYNRRSLFAAQAWVRFGLLAGRPWASPARLIHDRLESHGTRVYDRRQVRSLFAGLTDPSVHSVVTAWDLRVARRRFLPRWTRSVVPSRFGWFVVVDGRKT